MSSGDFLSLTSLEQLAVARERFESVGHLGIEAAYVADVADPAADEAYASTHSQKPMNRVDGECVYNLPSVLSPGWLSGLIGSMRETVSLLGRDIKSPIDDTKLKALLLDTEAGTQGMLHIDRHATEAVAITTLRGQSWLEFPDTSYMLEAGRIVVHDPARELPHRGVNDSDRQRTGLTVLRGILPANPLYKR